MKLTIDTTNDVHQLAIISGVGAFAALLFTAYAVKDTAENIADLRESVDDLHEDTEENGGQTNAFYVKCCIDDAVCCVASVIKAIGGIAACVYLSAKAIRVAHAILKEGRG